MGRGLEFDKYIREVDMGPSLDVLKRVLDGHREGAEGERPLFLTIVRVHQPVRCVLSLVPPPLERCCSPYGLQEERYPRGNTTYRIEACEYLDVANEHGSFTMEVIYCRSLDPAVFVTWALLEDGTVVNHESLQVRQGARVVMAHVP